MEIGAHLQNLFYLTSRVPSKEALPPVSLHKGPIERDAPPPEPLSAISKSPVDEPIPGCPTSPHEDRCLSPEPSFHNPRSSVKVPSPVSLFRGRCPIPRAPFIHLSKSPVEEPPSRFSSRTPMEIDACLQSLCS